MIVFLAYFTQILAQLLLQVNLGAAQTAHVQARVDRTTASPTTAVQLFDHLARSAVAVGEAFPIDLEVLASTDESLTAERIVRSVDKATIDLRDSPVELVRTRPGQVDVMRFREGSAVSVRKRFLIRVTSLGVVQIPGFRLNLDGVWYSTAPREVVAYRLQPGWASAERSTVPIVSERTTRSGRRIGRAGTAVVVGPDALATALHVVLDADHVLVRLPNGKSVNTRRLWAVDIENDVAILHVPDRRLRAAGVEPIVLAPPPAPARSGRDVPDDVVLTTGYPGGSARSTVGILFQDLDLGRPSQLWVSDNGVRPGDSGGPLVNTTGEMLGIVTAGSVATGAGGMLREDVCIATDPRPALSSYRFAGRSRTFNRVFADRTFAADPSLRALRLSTALSTGTWSASNLADLIVDFQSSTSPDGADASTLFMQGVVLQLLGTPTKAAASFRRALASDGGYFPASFLLALHHLDSEEYDLADKYFRVSGASRAYANVSDYGRALVRMKEGRYDEATELLAQVLRADGSFGQGMYELGRAYLARGDIEHARQLLLKLRHRHPTLAHRLLRDLRYPIFRPHTVDSLPRAELRSLPPTNRHIP